MFKLKQDLYRFYRNVCLKAFYSSRPIMNSGSPLKLSISNLELKNKITFVPLTSCSAAELFISNVKVDVNQFLHDQSRRDHRQNNLKIGKNLLLHHLCL